MSADSGLDDKLVARARRDAARRAGVSSDKISVKVVEAVTWPDSSLGCPRKGRAYAQVLAPGYRLVLSAGAADFEYHTDGRRRVLFCQAQQGGNRAKVEGGVT